MPQTLEFGLDTFGDVTRTADGRLAAHAEVVREFFPDHKPMRDRIGAERGWPPIERPEFEAEIEGGSLYVGSLETVARKIAATARALGIARFHLKYSAGPLPHQKLMRCVELYGTRVMPLVRDMLR